MKVHWKFHRSDKLSVMNLCPYVLVYEPFKRRNVSFPGSINLSDLKDGISDICAPISIRYIVSEFLPIMWKSGLELERLT